MLDIFVLKYQGCLNLTICDHNIIKKTKYKAHFFFNLQYANKTRNFIIVSTENLKLLLSVTKKRCACWHTNITI